MPQSGGSRIAPTPHHRNLEGRKQYTRLVFAAVLSANLVIWMVFMRFTATVNADRWQVIDLTVAFNSIAVIAIAAFLLKDYSACLIYAIYLWTHHLSALLMTGLAESAWSLLPEHMASWGQAISWHAAGVLCLVCEIAFLLGVTLRAGLRLADRRRLRSTDGPAATRCHVVSFWLGITMTSAGIGLLLSAVASGGWGGAFAASYADRFETVFQATFGWGFHLCAIGSIIALATADRRLVWLPICLQAFGSILLLALGSRGPALIGPLAMTICAIKRGLRPGRVLVAAGVIFVLWICAVVGVSRDEGTSFSLAGGASVSGLRTVIEMGTTLQTVSLCYDWLSAGEPLRGGQGYLVPFERAMAVVFPWFRGDPANDERTLSTVILNRSTGLGGSVVAEAVFNFGVWAPLVVMLPLGILLAWCEWRATTLDALAQLGVVQYAFLFQIRDYFTSVPGHIFVGFALLWAAQRLCVRPAIPTQERGGPGETASSGPHLSTLDGGSSS